MPISGNPNHDKRQIPASKIKGSKPTNSHPTKPQDWQTGLNWTNNQNNQNNETTDPPTIINPPTPPTPTPPTPTPPTPETQPQQVTYATIDNPIIIDIARSPEYINIQGIKQRWPNWNGKYGEESEFIKPGTRQDKLVVEPVEMQSIWTGHLDNPYNNKHNTIKTNKPLQNVATTEDPEELPDTEISLAKIIKQHQNRTTLQNLTDQNPYKPLDNTVQQNNDHPVTIWRYKIYNTYWANQGTYETTQNGVHYYTSKNLQWIVNIVQLPTPNPEETPINPYCAFLGMVQNKINGLEKLDTTHFQNATGMLAFNPCLKTEYTLNLPNLQHADFMFAGNLEYNKPAKWNMPKLKTITFAYFDTEKNNQPAENLLHSTNVQRAEAYIAAGYNQQQSLKNLQYPNIKNKPTGYNDGTPTNETYWD